jgi:hypothetical protein
VNPGLIITLLSSPAKGWEQVKQEGMTIKQCYGRYVVPLSLIAAISAYIGTSLVGWRVGYEDTVTLTGSSALKLSILSFLAMLVVVYVVAKTIHWMASTYDSHRPLEDCFLLAAFSAVPLYLVGITLLYPVPWFIYLVGLPALGYSVALLYTGVPIMMDVNKEKGFLFSSAILAFGLVALVGLIVVTVSLWGFGIGPSFRT